MDFFANLAGSRELLPGICISTGFYARFKYKVWSSGEDSSRVSMVAVFRGEKEGDEEVRLTLVDNVPVEAMYRIIQTAQPAPDDDSMSSHSHATSSDEGDDSLSEDDELPNAAKERK